MNRHHSLLCPLALALLLTGFTACKQGETAATAPTKPAEQPMLPSAPGPAAQTAGPPNQAAGVSWTIPAGWETEAPRQMRIATYRIHAIAGDPEDAECAVYFFGPGQGGTVEANLKRWSEQFSAPNGQSQPKMEKLNVDGLTVSTISESGTYLGGGPMMGQPEAKKSNFRMEGAIVEAPQGLVFLKLVGPLNTVASASGDLKSLLQSLHKQ